jgi:hypothetical protein
MFKAQPLGHKSVKLPPGRMNAKDLQDALGALATDVEAVAVDAWIVSVQGRRMAAYVSTAKDRLRIVARVSSKNRVDSHALLQLLHTNFHCDARYALYDGRLQVVYLHRLSTLHEEDLGSALREVADLCVVDEHGKAKSGMKFDWPRPAGRAGGVRVRSLESVQADNHRLRGGKTDPGLGPISTENAAPDTIRQGPITD